MSEKKYYEVTTNPLEIGPLKASLYLTTDFGSKIGVGSEFIADFETEEKAKGVCAILNQSLKSQPSPAWVKASEFDIKRNVVYHAIYVDKNQIIKGSGFFNINDWFIWDNKEIEERYKDDWGKLLILDESGTFAAP